MAEKKRKPKDPTAKRRVAGHEERLRAAGLVPVNAKVWVPAEAEDEARAMLQKTKRQIEAKWPKPKG